MNSTDKYNLIWSLIVFIFIIALVIIFKNAGFCWLLIVWLLGWKWNENECTNNKRCFK